MDPARWEQVVELYEKASAHDQAGRNAFLAGACNDDQELYREVQSLLDQGVTAPDFLKASLSGVPPRARPLPSAPIELSA